MFEALSNNIVLILVVLGLMMLLLEFILKKLSMHVNNISEHEKPLVFEKESILDLTLLWRDFYHLCESHLIQVPIRAHVFNPKGKILEHYCKKDVRRFEFPEMTFVGSDIFIQFSPMVRDCEILKVEKDFICKLAELKIIKSWDYHFKVESQSNLSENRGCILKISKNFRAGDDDNFKDFYKTLQWKDLRFRVLLNNRDKYKLRTPICEDPVSARCSESGVYEVIRKEITRGFKLENLQVVCQECSFVHRDVEGKK